MSGKFRLPYAMAALAVSFMSIPNPNGPGEIKVKIRRIRQEFPDTFYATPPKLSKRAKRRLKAKA